MKWSVSLVAALALSAVAASPRKAMVLKVAGSPTASGSGSVRTGQMWEAGEVVDVPAKASLTWLALSKGQRFQVVGPARLQVTADGVKVLKGKATQLATVEPRLSLSGENHRRIGGVTVRNASYVDPLSASASLDRVVIRDAERVVEVSRPAGSWGSAPVLGFYFYRNFEARNLVDRSLVQNELGEPEVYREARAELVDGRWVYAAALPNGEPPEDFGFRVATPDGQELLYTRLHWLSAAEHQQLVQAEEQTRRWAEKEPNSPQPWLVYASLLEEKGQLAQALDALQKALEKSPDDPGLRNMKARILMDLGNYREAMKLVYN